MSKTIPVLKDVDGQRPIPSVWRNTFIDVVDAFRRSDFSLAGGVAGVHPLSQETATRIASNIKSYGAQLAALPDESWQTSACQWMGNYWDVLVDLFTIEEGASDLTMAVRVYEEGATYVFEIQSVYVP